jgi:putative membrane-bound dehydrogenase-like protein
MPYQLRRRFSYASCCLIGSLLSWTSLSDGADSNRLAYLDEFCDPYSPGLDLPRLTTPQWVGEDGVDAVIILSIDDMREAGAYEEFLRPIMTRLQQIDGRAPVSIMANDVALDDPLLPKWLEEGVSLETHTADHPCPLLSGEDLTSAKSTYDRCVDHFFRVPGNVPVCFRTPCMDGMNSPSPRLYAEIIRGRTPGGHFLTMSSSVGHLFDADDMELPRELVRVAADDPRDGSAADGDPRAGRFDRWLPEGYVNFVRNYPYPYVVGRLVWELPFSIPNDYQGQLRRGPQHAATVADMLAALDLAVAKQGLFVLAFHPGAWMTSVQVVEIIDHAVATHGSKVKFLSFREAQARLDRHLLGGQPLRAADGGDNGVRVLDLNDDGFMDVVIGNSFVHETRVWSSEEQAWERTSFPVDIVTVDERGRRYDAGARFGVVREDGAASLLLRNEQESGCWHFEQGRWVRDDRFLRRLRVDGEPVYTAQAGRDRGVRFLDVTNDGSCELIVGNESQNAVFTWLREGAVWHELPFRLPQGTAIVDADGRDHGLRFVDVDRSGFRDVVFSNAERYSLHLYIDEPGKLRAFDHVGWTRPIVSGVRGEAGEIPMIARGGNHNNNGAWFADGEMRVGNEFTDTVPHRIVRRSYDGLMRGYQPRPLTPPESMATMRLPPGFDIELVAAEPVVVDPIALDWGADGRMWVVEMRDYPSGVDGQSGGTVRVLEDRDADGKYEHGSLFATGLNYPSGAMPWRDGVLISAAPDILFARDTDGDGRADVKEVLFTGFRLGNQQHRVNGFSYGLDNWLYGANGFSGGQIKSLMTGVVTDISGRDFRFLPDTGVFQTQSGTTEFGRHRDDWGNWFGNTHANWGYHFFLPLHYIERNPHLAVRRMRRDIARYPGASRVYRTSRVLSRPHMARAIDGVTAPCSVSPYRDELFGPGFERVVFISEVDKNVLRREVLQPSGVSFTSRRSPDDDGREFLTAEDIWFRPAQAKTGPDGALYIADMYRLYIEHEEYYPDDLRELLDFRAGDDKGRIYRIRPHGAERRSVPRLDQLDTAGLVAALESPNGWQRDTVQRLLVCAPDPVAAAPLERLARTSLRPVVRLQALCALEGINALTARVARRALEDPHPGVRQHAVRVSERLLRKTVTSREGGPDMAALEERLLAMTSDPSLRVRYQLAFTLGEWSDSRVGAALARLALQDGHVTEMHDAVLSSAPGHLAALLRDVLPPAESDPPHELVRALTEVAVLQDDEGALIALLDRVASRGGDSLWAFVAVETLLDVLGRRNETWGGFVGAASTPLRDALTGLSPFWRRVEVLAMAEDSDREELRAAAIRLFGRDGESKSKTTRRLAGLLQPGLSPRLAAALLANFSRSQDTDVAERLLDSFGQFGPTLRGRLLSVLLERPQWTVVLLATVERGEVSVGDIGTLTRRALLEHSDEKIRSRSAALFATAREGRQQLLERYRDLTETDGSASRGADLFREHCSSCHRFRGEGAEVAPALDDFTTKSVALFVENVLDPNQAVDSDFVQYAVVTRDGRTLGGLLRNETRNSVTVLASGTEQHTLLRRDIEHLMSSGRSLMPEGLERVLPPPAMADLVAWIKSDG